MLAQSTLTVSAVSLTSLPERACARRFLLVVCINGTSFSVFVKQSLHAVVVDSSVAEGVGPSAWCPELVETFRSIGQDAGYHLMQAIETEGRKLLVERESLWSSIPKTETTTIPWPSTGTVVAVPEAA